MKTSLQTKAISKLQLFKSMLKGWLFQRILSLFFIFQDEKLKFSGREQKDLQITVIVRPSHSAALYQTLEPSLSLQRAQTHMEAQYHYGILVTTQCHHDLQARLIRIYLSIILTHN